MHAMIATGMLAVAVSLAACGGSDEPEEKPMKVEDTAFGPLIGTQDKARDRANAAFDQHRENLDERLQEDEGGGNGEPAGD